MAYVESHRRSNYSNKGQIRHPSTHTIPKEGLMNVYIAADFMGHIMKLNFILNAADWSEQCIRTYCTAGVITARNSLSNNLSSTYTGHLESRSDKGIVVGLSSTAAAYHMLERSKFSTIKTTSHLFLK